MITRRIPEEGKDDMSKNRVRAAIAGGVVVAGLLAGGGIVYATTTGSADCGPAPQLSKAIGPDGSTAADASEDKGGPLCVAPVAPVAPLTQP